MPPRPERPSALESSLFLSQAATLRRRAFASFALPPRRLIGAYPAWIHAVRRANTCCGERLVPGRCESGVRAWNARVKRSRPVAPSAGGAALSDAATRGSGPAWPSIQAAHRQLPGPGDVAARVSHGKTVRSGRARRPSLRQPLDHNGAGAGDGFPGFFWSLRRRTGRAWATD